MDISLGNHKHKLGPHRTDRNPCQFSLTQTLIVWVEATALHHRAKHTHLAQKSEKLKEEPRGKVSRCANEVLAG